MHFNRILVIRTDRIGDVILTLPVIDILKQRYPDASIDFLVNRRVYDLVSDYPNINKVHPIEKERLEDIRNICLSGDYELAVVVRPKFSTAMALVLAGVKYRLGTAYRWYSFLFNLRHYQHRKYSVKHELEYNVDLLRGIGIEVHEYPSPHLRIDESAAQRVKRKLQTRGIDPESNFIIVHPTSLGSALGWKKQSFGRLIELLRKDFDVVVTGLDEPDFEYGLRELVALISMGKMFVSNSTGPVHIAAAVGTFAVGIYSPRRAESPVRWGPYTEKKKLFVPGQPPSDPPLLKGNSKDVMDSIKPEEVFAFIKNYMEKK